MKFLTCQPQMLLLFIAILSSHKYSFLLAEPHAKNWSPLRTGADSSSGWLFNQKKISSFPAGKDVEFAVNEVPKMLITIVKLYENQYFLHQRLTVFSTRPRSSCSNPRCYILRWIHWRPRAASGPSTLALDGLVSSPI